MSDGLTGDAVVRMVVYDVREQVTETAVPMGSTSLKLSTIQVSFYFNKVKYVLTPVILISIVMQLCTQIG